MLQHYGLRGRKIQAGRANENGDIEQRHFRFKKAVDQALMLRGSRDFSSRDEYRTFLDQLFQQLNAGRQSRLIEEVKALKPLPVRRLNDCKRQRVKAGPSSTIHVQHNVYSVPSRLIREWVDVKIYAGYLEIWYTQKHIETIPRLKGEYRHVIDWLVRKPGAFENYRYHADLFPTSRFRMAYDYLKQNNPARADKEYLERKENILSFGNPGSGKTHLLSAIGQEVIHRMGKRVYFTQCSLLVQELLNGKSKKI